MIEELEKFSDLRGCTLLSVENVADEEIVFTLENGDVYKLYHGQNCCESVRVEDIDNDLDVLVGSEILIADESSEAGNPKNKYGDSSTWTFYRMMTAKGGVTIRWYGTSNGYYSESVDFVKVGRQRTYNGECEGL